jgi:peptidoglycan-N-acetylglucosamine deacetylase
VKQTNAEDNGSRSLDRAAARARISRRVLFAAGGVTLVAGCTPLAAQSVGVVGAAGSASGATVPTQRSAPGRTTAPGGASSSRRASTPPATPPGIGPPVDPATVRTVPEYYVHAGAKTIALTLDDGPTSQYTPQILEILAQYGVRATFCMIGRQVGAAAGIVREVAAAGHAITNHTWDHADQTKLPYGAIVSQIERTNDALAAVGVRPQIYRAPYGNWSPPVFRACAAFNLRPLDWSVDPRDWSRPGVQSIVSNILRHTRTGSIILDHDGGGDRSQTVAAMRIWLPQLLADGYRFTSV